MTIGLGLIIASVISAFAMGAGALYTNAQNKKNQQKAFEQQKELMEKEQQMNYEAQDRTFRMYNSPTAQRKSMEIAGLNPFAEASPIQPMSTSSPEISGATPPGFQSVNNPFAGFQSVSDAFASGASMHQQQEFVDAQTTLANARANNELLQGELLQNAVDMKEYSNIVLQEGAIGSKLENRFKELRNDLLQIEKNYAPEERAAKVQELWASYELKMESAAKTREEKEIVRRMAKYTERKEEAVIHAHEANAALAEKQAKESESRAANLDADTETQNQTREAIVRDAKAKAALSEAEEALIASNSEARKIQNDLNNWLATQKMERKPTESYYQMALDITDRFLEYRGQNVQKDIAKKQGKSNNNSLILGMILRYMITKGL